MKEKAPPPLKYSVELACDGDDTVPDEWMEEIPPKEMAQIKAGIRSIFELIPERVQKGIQRIITMAKE